jgi:hypothetical protein
MDVLSQVSVSWAIGMIAHTEAKCHMIYVGWSARSQSQGSSIADGV